MRFLVIDDSAVDRRFLVALLEKLGHEVEYDSSAEGIVERVTSQRYDAVFLDIVMPDQDGYKILRSLRSNPATSHQDVVLYSSKKTALEIKYGLDRAGANYYLPKPASKESLTEILQQVATA